MVPDTIILASHTAKFKKQTFTLAPFRYGFLFLISESVTSLRELTA